MCASATQGATGARVAAVASFDGAEAPASEVADTRKEYPVAGVRPARSAEVAFAATRAASA